MNWHPADTAPRDGTVILGVFSGMVYACVWNDPSKTWHTAQPETGLFGGEYVDHYFETGSEKIITKWMPLPERPANDH